MVRKRSRVRVPTSAPKENGRPRGWLFSFEGTGNTKRTVRRQWRMKDGEAGMESRHQLQKKIAVREDGYFLLKERGHEANCPPPVADEGQREGIGRRILI